VTKKLRRISPLGKAENPEPGVELPKIQTKTQILIRNKATKFQHIHQLKKNYNRDCFGNLAHPMNTRQKADHDPVFANSSHIVALI